MKTLLFLILWFLLFGWLGMLVLGVGLAVFVDWAAHHWWGILIVVILWAWAKKIRSDYGERLRAPKDPRRDPWYKGI